MYTGTAKLPDGREVYANGTMEHIAEWVADLISLYGNIECNIKEVKA